MGTLWLHSAPTAPIHSQCVGNTCHVLPTHFIQLHLVSWMKGAIQAIYLPAKMILGAADVPRPRANFPMITSPVCIALLLGPEHIEVHSYLSLDLAPSFL